MSDNAADFALGTSGVGASHLGFSRSFSMSGLELLTVFEVMPPDEVAIAQPLELMFNTRATTQNAASDQHLRFKTGY